MYELKSFLVLIFGCVFYTLGGLNGSEYPNATQSSHHYNHHETFTDVHWKDFLRKLEK